jgi:hypothetical protein
MASADAHEPDRAQQVKIHFIYCTGSSSRLSASVVIFRRYFDKHDVILISYAGLSAQPKVHILAPLLTQVSMVSVLDIEMKTSQYYIQKKT